LARVLAEGVPERLPVLKVQLPSGGAIALSCRLVEGKTVVQLWEVASSRMENVRHNKEGGRQCRSGARRSGVQQQAAGYWAACSVEWAGRQRLVERRTGFR